MSHPSFFKKQRAFTIMELSIALVIVLLLLGATAPFVVRYRGKSSVNTSIEVCKAVIERAGEIAKTAGYPIPKEIKQNGVSDQGATELAEGSDLSLRIRKRLGSGAPLTLVSQKLLSSSTTLSANFQQLGYLDLEADTDISGVFVEFVETSAGDPERVLCTLPIDVNGEFALYGNSSKATVTLGYGHYRRVLELTQRGTVTLERR